MKFPQSSIFQLGYPWSWWADPDDFVVVSVSGAVPGQDLVFSDEGAPIAPRAYARIAFELSVDGSTVRLPWIPVTVDSLVIPVPKEIGDFANIVVHAAPGVAVSLERVEAKDFEKPKKPKKPKKSKKKDEDDE